MSKINKSKVIIALISVLMFITLIFMVFFSKNNIIDGIIFDRSKNATTIFSYLTRLGDWYTLIIITLMLLILKNKKYFKYTSINLAIITLLNQLLKNIIKRPRPVIGDGKFSGYSFPSGHAMVSMAFYGLLIYLVFSSNLNKKVKILLITCLSLIILLIGFSRIYLGAHYITDVLSGFTLSIFYLTIYTSLIKMGDE